MGHLPSVKSSGYTGNLRAMSSRMPLPMGRKSLCRGGWEEDTHPSALCPCPVLPAQATSALHLRGSVGADGAHAVVLRADARTVAHYGEQLSLMYQGLLEFLLRAGLQELLAEGDV